MVGVCLIYKVGTLWLSLARFPSRTLINMEIHSSIWKLLQSWQLTLPPKVEVIIIDTLQWATTTLVEEDISPSTQPGWRGEWIGKGTIGLNPDTLSKKKATIMLEYPKFFLLPLLQSESYFLKIGINPEHQSYKAPCMQSTANII